MILQPAARSSPSTASLPLPPLTPTYTKPRPAPPKPPSITNTLRAAFHRPPSVRSAFSADTQDTDSSDNRSSVHPYAQPRMAPISVVAHGGPDDDDECPVCLEPLSFSFRLPGEKPHIVPECGHALHEVRVLNSNLTCLTPSRRASPRSTAHRLAPRADQCLASPTSVSAGCVGAQ